MRDGNRRCDVVSLVPTGTTEELILDIQERYFFSLFSFFFLSLVFILLVLAIQSFTCLLFAP